MQRRNFTLISAEGLPRGATCVRTAQFGIGKSERLNRKMKLSGNTVLIACERICRSQKGAGTGQTMTPVDPFRIGRVHFSNPSLNPSRQVVHLSFQESSDFALRFDEPRSSVITAMPYSPTANRASHFGTRLGGCAPNAP